MSVVFHPDVELDISDSYHWYEGKTPGLGDDFLTELESSYDAVVEMPDTWPKFQKGFRRFLLSRFPFSVIYRKESNTIYIVAVMHNSRCPGYWKDRL